MRIASLLDPALLCDVGGSLKEQPVETYSFRSSTSIGTPGWPAMVVWRTQDVLPC
jgi:hypothetical protein